MTSITDLSGHYLKYEDEILHPRCTHQLAIYGDASINHHETAGIGVLIPKIAAIHRKCEFSTGQAQLMPSQ